jgi:hypothetical protein
MLISAALRQRQTVPFESYSLFRRRDVYGAAAFNSSSALGLSPTLHPAWPNHIPMIRPIFRDLAVI